MQTLTMTCVLGETVPFFVEQFLACIQKDTKGIMIKNYKMRVQIFIQSTRK